MKPIISSNIRLRHPQYFDIGDNSIVDDFCYFSARVKVGIGSHIANGCCVAGGPNYQFSMGDFSSLSSGVKIWCATNDFVNDLVAILPEDIEELQGVLITGDVSLGNYTGVGSNSVILPNNHIPEGTTIGALSLVPSGFHFLPWSVYAGIPVKLVRSRNKQKVLAQAEILRNWYGAHEHDE